MTLANVVVTRSGTGWTVDVTACELSTDTSIKDFSVFQDGLYIANTDYAKTTYTTLTYTGVSLPSTQVEIRRKTPNTFGQSIVAFPTKLSASSWNTAFQNTYRHFEEYDLNGAGTVTSTTPKDDAYGTGWNGDSVYPPTRNAVYDKFEAISVVDTAYGAGWNADTTHPPSRNAVYDKIESLRVNKPALTSKITSGQNITHDSWQAVLYPVKELDSSGIYDVNTGYIYIPAGYNGFYFISASVFLQSGTTANQLTLALYTTTGDEVLRLASVYDTDTMVASVSGSAAYLLNESTSTVYVVKLFASATTDRNVTSGNLSIFKINTD